MRILISIFLLLLRLLLLCLASNDAKAEESPMCSDNTINKQEKVELLRDQFNEEGYLVLKDFFNNDDDDQNIKNLLGNDWYTFSNNYWNRIFETLYSKGHISEPNHVMNEEYMTGKLRNPGYKEIVHRYPGRYELSLSSQSLLHSSSPVKDEEDKVKNDDEKSKVLYHDRPSIQPIIKQLEPIVLSILEQHPKYKDKETEIDTSADNNNEAMKKEKKYNVICSMLISTYGAHSQKFHIDTKHINDKYPQGGFAEDEHWTAHILNVFIPLLNITTEDLGPTELIPKSHYESRILYSDSSNKIQHTTLQKQQAQSKMRQSDHQPIAPLLNVGDVLMFDFRTLHRGLSNIDEREINRPMLVLAFSIPSFEDEANWPGPSIFD